MTELFDLNPSQYFSTCVCFLYVVMHFSPFLSCLQPAESVCVIFSKFFNCQSWQQYVTWNSHASGKATLSFSVLPTCFSIRGGGRVGGRLGVWGQRLANLI